MNLYIKIYIIYIEEWFRDGAQFKYDEKKKRNNKKNYYLKIQIICW